MRIEIPGIFGDGSLEWFASLAPDIRAVYIQAIHEGEGSPPPMPRKRCDYRRSDCTNEGVEIHGVWVCSNHYPVQMYSFD